MSVERQGSTGLGALATLRELLDHAEDLAVLAAARRRQRGDAGGFPTPPDRAAHAIRATRAGLRVPEPGCTSGLGLSRGAGDFVFTDDEGPLVDAMYAIDDAWANLIREVDAGAVQDLEERRRVAAAVALRARAEAAPALALRLRTPLSDDPIGPVSAMRDVLGEVAARLEPGGPGTRFPGLHTTFSAYVPATTTLLDPRAATDVRLEALVVRDELPHAQAYYTCEGGRLLEVLDAALSASTTYGHPLELVPYGPPRSATVETEEPLG